MRSCLHASPVPWVVALVEDMQTDLTPARVYQVVPEDLKQNGERQGAAGY